MLCCLWGRGQRGNSAAYLLFSSVLRTSSCETGSISHLGNPSLSPPSTRSLSFPLKSVPPLQLCGAGAWPSAPPLSCLATVFLSPEVRLVVLVDFFFNALVVRVPCSLIFWHFWLFIDFRLVVILLVVQGSKGFLPTPPSWQELCVFNFF